MIFLKIKQRKDELRLTYKQIAERIGVDINTISRLANKPASEYNTTLNTVDRLCKALEITDISDLVEYRPDSA